MFLWHTTTSVLIKYFFKNIMQFSLTMQKFKTRYVFANADSFEGVQNDEGIVLGNVHCISFYACRIR